jgi:hypothetical protein
METSILKYLPRHQVLLCTACPESYCLPPNSIATHLRNFHNTILSKKQRAAIVKYSKTVTLKDPEDIEIPHREQGPVPGLHLVEGFECLECGYVCASLDTMSEGHCRPTHGWSRGKPLIWKQQYVQVLLDVLLWLI